MSDKMMVEQGGGFLMETIFYTYQDFYTHTKGILYLLMIISLVGIAGFWNFLSGKDDDNKENE